MKYLYCVECRCRTPRNFAAERIFNGVYCETCAKIKGFTPEQLSKPPAPPTSGSSVQPAKHRLWAINLDGLSAGAFGDPHDPETMARYWRAQAEAGYPYASENARYYEEKMKEDPNL